MEQIKVKLLNRRAKMPAKAHPSDAGFDLVATSGYYNETDHVWDYGLGIAMSIPEGYYGKIVPRSSIYRTGLVLSNSEGIIDCHYRGEIRAKFYEVVDKSLVIPYQIGERVAQIIIEKLPATEMVQVEELDETDRGIGGYGSTGK